MNKYYFFIKTNPWKAGRDSSFEKGETTMILNSIYGDKDDADDWFENWVRETVSLCRDYDDYILTDEFLEENDFDKSYVEFYEGEGIYNDDDQLILAKGDASFDHDGYYYWYFRRDDEKIDEISLFLIEKYEGIEELEFITSLMASYHFGIPRETIGDWAKKNEIISRGDIRFIGGREKGMINVKSLKDRMKTIDNITDDVAARSRHHVSDILIKMS